MIARGVELIPDSANTTKRMASSAVKCAYLWNAGKARRGTGGKRPYLELVLNSLSREAQTQTAQHMDKGVNQVCLNRAVLDSLPHCMITFLPFSGIPLWEPCCSTE